MVVGLSDAAGSVLITRTRVTDFSTPVPVGAPLHLIAAGTRGVFVFMADGTLYRLDGAALAREHDLPNRAMPRTVAAWEAQLYALIPARAAASLPLGAPAIPATQRDVNAAGTDQLALVLYQDRRWTLLGVLPALTTGLPGGATPRLSAGPDEEVRVTWAVERAQLATLRFDATQGWQPGPTMGLPGLREFWRTRLSDVATLVFVGDAPDHELRLIRDLPSLLPPAEVTPRIERVELSALPAGVTASEILDIAAFNDHLVALTRTTTEDLYLQFGRLAGPALLTTVNVHDLQQAAVVAESTESLVNTLSFLAMVGVLLSLFLLRRQALSAPHNLPVGVEPAFALQRLATALVDLLPFALIWAAVLGLDWLDASARLSEWAFQRTVPDPTVLLWWGVTVASYTIYALVMETLARRTVGKALFGTRVVGPGAARPTFVRLLARNLLRIVELAPPMWIINLLVIISRNRQRLGDIFAGTFVVRLLRRPPAG